MCQTRLLLTLCIAVQFGLRQVLSEGLNLKNADSVRRWQVPSATKNSIRTGRKYKDLDRIFSHDNKRSLHWGWHPDLNIREIDFEDDPEKLILDHNYKAFLEDDDISVPRAETETRVNKNHEKRTFNSRNANLKSSANILDFTHIGKSSLIASTVPRSSETGLNIADSKTAKRRVGIHHKRVSRSVGLMIPSVKVHRRSLADADEAIQTARAAIAKIESKRQLGNQGDEIRKMFNTKKNQVHVLSLDGVNPVTSQVMSEESAKEKQLWESRQEALRLLQGAGVNLDETNKKKIENGMKFSQNTKNSLQNNLLNKVHDQTQNKVQSQILSPVKERNQKPKINLVEANIQKTVMNNNNNNNKNVGDKPLKGLNGGDGKKVKPVRSRIGPGPLGGKGPNFRPEKGNQGPLAKGNNNKNKIGRGNVGGELIQRTKIESPELGRKEKMRIVPSNVARAVAMAMEQLRRDKMWGKVFVHVLPSGKLKVMVQETKKMEDD